MLVDSCRETVADIRSYRGAAARPRTHRFFACITVHPGDGSLSCSFYDGAGNDRAVGFDEYQLVAFPTHAGNVIDPPFSIEVGILRCAEVR